MQMLCGIKFAVYRHLVVPIKKIIPRPKIVVEHTCIIFLHNINSMYAHSTIKLIKEIGTYSSARFISICGMHNLF